MVSVVLLTGYVIVGGCLFSVYDVMVMFFVRYSRGRKNCVLVDSIVT